MAVWFYVQSGSQVNVVMKLLIAEIGDLSRTLPMALVASAFLASAAGSALFAQTINPLNTPAPATSALSPGSAQLPWIADVTKMADAGVAPDVMETYVKNTPSYSTLSVDDILYLKSHGIEDKVITAMIQHGANGQQAAVTAGPAPQYAPPPQYYAAAPAQSYYPPADYGRDQSSVYVIPQYYPNYYNPYPYYSYSYPIFWDFGFGFGGRRFFRGFDHDRFGRGGFHGGFGGPGFHGGFGGAGFHGGFTGHPGGGGRSPFSPVAPIGFHGGGGGVGMHGGGGMGMHSGGGGMGMHGGGGFHR
jgi:hypothetical protein